VKWFIGPWQVAKRQIWTIALAINAAISFTYGDAIWGWVFSAMTVVAAFLTEALAIEDRRRRRDREWISEARKALAAPAPVSLTKAEPPPTHAWSASFDDCPACRQLARRWQAEE
jgi:hypothetical protein